MANEILPALQETHARFLTALYAIQGEESRFIPVRDIADHAKLTVEETERIGREFVDKGWAFSVAPFSLLLTPAGRDAAVQYLCEKE